MAKGFKDDNGKFHPTERKLIKPVKQDKEMKQLEQQFSKEVSEKRASELRELKGRTKETRVFKFEDLEPDVQEKVLERERENIGEFGDTFFSEDEGLIFDEKTKFAGTDVFKNGTPKFFDVGSNRGTDFVQFELNFKEPEVESEKKLSKFLGISEALRLKIQYRFVNGDERFPSSTPNTKLVFRDEEVGDVIDLDKEYKENPTGFDNFAGFSKENTPTREEYEALQNAVEKFSDLMHQALVHLTNNYEFQFEDETIKENLEANEREFEKDGTPA